MKRDEWELAKGHGLRESKCIPWKERNIHRVYLLSPNKLVEKRRIASCQVSVLSLMGSTKQSHLPWRATGLPLSAVLGRLPSQMPCPAVSKL